jgi:hypothetical protein
MPIKYYLQPNPVTPDPNDQSARISAGSVFNLDDIIKMMMERGTMVTETDARAVVLLFMDVVAKAVANGNNVNTPLVNLRPGITGVFTSVLDNFDPSRHTLRANLSSGTLLLELMAAAAVEKITQPMPAPVILEYLDIGSGVAGSIITPTGIGQITGEELKYDPQNPAEGIFFIATNGTETKVTSIARRTEGQLMFSNPAGLAAGNYSLEVRRNYTKDGALRRGILEGLRVA